MDLEIYDTTARDGAQGPISSINHETRKELVQMIHGYMPDALIEVSYANAHIDPAKTYAEIRNSESIARMMVAFGSTHKPDSSPKDCSNLADILATGCKTVTIFGKSSPKDAQGLGVEPLDYLPVITNSISHLLNNGVDRVIYDAERFFGALTENADYAMATLDAAIAAGADTITLCNTRGGLLAYDMKQVLDSHRFQNFVNNNPNLRLGIHCHDDSAHAVANSHFFVDYLAEKAHNSFQIQGVLNGYGERCGNANLTTIIGNLISKRKMDLNIKSEGLKKFAIDVAKLMKVPLSLQAQYVGKLAFAHKAGQHGFSARRGRGYNHVDPQDFGNRERFLVTSMAGREFFQHLAAKFGYKLEKESDHIRKLRKYVSFLEASGYSPQLSSAEHLLMVHDILGEVPFDIGFDDWMTQSNYESSSDGYNRKSRTILNPQPFGLVSPAEEVYSSYKGPVDSQFKCMKKFLSQYFDVESVHLTDFNVDIANREGPSGSESSVIAYISFRDNGNKWTTQGVSQNILKASLEAISKGYRYHILRQKIPQYAYS